MHKLSLVVCLLAAVAVRQPTYASPLQTYLGDVKSMSAEFEQQVQGEETTRQNKSYGRIQVQSPNRFRLEYHKPYKQLYIADGERLWAYDEDLEQVTVKKQAQLLANTPAMILSNPAELDTLYHITAQGTQNGLEWFALTPRRTDSGFEQIRLGFRHKKLNLFEMKDSFGQKTRLTFHEMQYNPKLSQANFSFTPPPGVDVIEENGSAKP